MPFNILYLAHNRLAFTVLTFERLLDTTRDRWNKITVYDDSSTDGTREYLSMKCDMLGIPFCCGLFGSPVSAMQDFAALRQDTEWLCKIDNDCYLPPYWTTHFMDTWRGTDCVGLEPYFWDPDCYANKLHVQNLKEHSHIGGIGWINLHRMFGRNRELLPSLKPRGTFGGWTEFQRESTGTKKAFLDPGIPVVLLDRVNREPYISLTREYQEKGWQRKTPGGFHPESLVERAELP